MVSRDGIMQNFRPTWLIALLLTSLLGCQSMELTPVDIKPFADDTVRLSRFSIESDLGGMYPRFDPAIRHYAARCRAGSPLILTIDVPEDSDLLINASESDRTSKFHRFVPELDTETLTVSLIKRGQSVQYEIQCLPEDFPQIRTSTGPGKVSPGLYIFGTRQRVHSKVTSYLMVVDRRGVPRNILKIDGVATNFRPEPGGKFSYQEMKGRTPYGHRDFEYVLLDKAFGELRRQSTIGLNNTDPHEGFITSSGSLILMAYNSAVRDMSAFSGTTQQQTRDSVIQEIGPEGDLLFEWNSWGQVDVNQCKVHRFPDDYAHLNSVSETAAGSLLASLRGCSQILNIDRKTGEVRWRLGAKDSDFEILGDPVGEFCGQHTAFESHNGTLIMFDNGGFCHGDRERKHGRFSRLVEYELDLVQKTATFIKDYSFHGESKLYTPTAGSVFETATGNFVIGWNNTPAPVITEITAEAELALEMTVSAPASSLSIYRVYKLENKEL